MMRPGIGMVRAAGALIAAAAIGGLVAPRLALADATTPKSAADCRAIADFEARGKCWDSLDTQSQKQADDAKEEKKRSFGLGIHPPSIAAILPSREQREREVKAVREEIRDQTMTVASADATPLGRLLLTSTDGAVWEQTDGDAVNNPPEPGDTVEVKKGMMGGYMCQVTRWQAVRCQRDR